MHCSPYPKSDAWNLGRPSAGVLYTDGTSEDVPKGRSVSAGELSEQRRFPRGAQLSDDYRAWVAPWMNGKQAIERAVQYKDQALAGNGPAQIQFLYAFISTLDNSVVREGEVGLPKAAADILDQARQYEKRWSGQGAVIPPKLMKQMADILDRVNADVTDRFNGMRESYLQTGRAWGVGEEFFPDINKMFPGGRRGAAAPGAAGNPAAVDSIIGRR